MLMPQQLADSTGSRWVAFWVLLDPLGCRGSSLPARSSRKARLRLPADSNGKRRKRSSAFGFGITARPQVLLQDLGGSIR